MLEPTAAAGRSWSHVACPLCDERNAEPYLRVPDRFELRAGDQYSVVRCRACGLVYLDPRPGERGYAGPAACRRQRAPSLPGQLLQRCATLWRARAVEGLTGHPGRLLDVGCGPGEFLAEMSRRGWQVAGLDADPKAVERARARLGPAVACHGVEELPPSSGPYDVITLWHVLEHLERPRQALQLLAAQLAPGGRLLIAVPNLESIDARTYGPDWVAWDAPRHLQHFTWATLERLCREQGLRPIARRGLPVDAPYNALMSERLRWKRRRMSVGLIVGLPRAAAVAAVSLATVYLGSRAPLRASTALSTWERSQPSAEPPP